MKCPITGINVPRFLLAGGLGFAFIFGFDFVFHGKFLMATYEQTPELWRTPEEMQTHFSCMLIAQALTALIVAFIYTRNHEGKGITEGVRFGVMIGALMGVLACASYVWLPISQMLAMSWAAGGLLTGIGLGVICSLTYKPCDK